MTQVPPAGGQPKNETLAVVSLIFGISGFVCLGIIGSIVAVITGSMAKKKIAASGGALGGEGLAKVGIILGWIGIILSIIAIIVVIIAFVFVGASSMQMQPM